MRTRLKKSLGTYFLLSTQTFLNPFSRLEIEVFENALVWIGLRREIRGARESEGPLFTGHFEIFSDRITDVGDRAA